VPNPFFCPKRNTFFPDIKGVGEFGSKDKEGGFIVKPLDRINLT